MRSFIASIHKLTPKRSGRNDPSAESSEEASATSSPQSSAEDAFPRFCLSLPTSPRPGDQPCRRSRVGNEGTLPAAPKEAKQTAPFRLPVLPHGASESFPQREPGPSTTTWAGRETDAAWAQFLGGQKPADEDASSYYPPWSVSARGASFSPHPAQEMLPCSVSQPEAAAAGICGIPFEAKD